MTNDAEHLLMYLLTLCVYSFVKYLFAPFAHFLFGSSVSLLNVRDLYVFSIDVLCQKYVLGIFYLILWLAFSFS